MGDLTSLDKGELIAFLRSDIEAWNMEMESLPASAAEALDLSGADLSRADLRTANLSHVNLRGANLRMADLSGAKLRKTFLVSANLKGANLSEDDKWPVDLSDANLIDADLSNSNCSDAGFHGALMQGATLYSANLSGAYFRWTDLSRSTLVDANLSVARITDSDLRGVNLNGANLSHAEFRGSILNGVVLNNTTFAGTSLAGANGLEWCRFDPSMPPLIDLRTIATSWPLPLKVLRALGLSEEYIQNLPRLLHEKLGFHSCFISYSSRDQEFASKLYNDLSSNGVLCWYAPHDVRGGEKLYEQIDKAIAAHDKILLILSDDSMNSEWVMTEVANARRRETESGSRLLFPVRIVDFSRIKAWTNFDADLGKDSAREIREYFTPDFSDWRNQSVYEESLRRVLRDLKMVHSGEDRDGGQS